MNASCEHFSEYFKDFGPTAFNIIHGIFSACVSQEARRQKVYVVGNNNAIDFGFLQFCALRHTVVGVREYVWKMKTNKWGRIHSIHPTAERKSHLNTTMNKIQNQMEEL